MLLIFIMLLTPILYFNIKYNNHDIAIYILLTLAILMVIVFNILHFKEHQKKQFNKIIKKFGVK